MIGQNLRRAPSALRDLLTSEAGGGLVLMAAAALGLLIANSALGASYFAALDAHVGPLSVADWINDALMAVFFLLVGLEIKREMICGELATWGRRALPGAGALGGMVVPALVYVFINRGDSASLRGWAIPAATDIAFALGVLSLFGKNIPVSLKIFLAALAIIDDLGAVVVIAVFYSQGLSLPMVGGAAACLLALACLNWRGVRTPWPYVGLGLPLWYFVHGSGVHATIAGVLLAATIPVDPQSRERSTLHRLEHALSPWVAYLVVPIFGFANAGVSFAGISFETLAHPVTLGVAAGLAFGKQIGVFAAVRAAAALGLASRPLGARWIQVYGVALLCGIGFTMSLFIGGLAFPHAEHLVVETKIGVLAGSVASALAGAALLAATRRKAPARRK
ncbi:MAG: Na+/H+ antiporter NhaA [Hyphomicrobiales bacterium]|nr:Na+/H+ antiporter NhaA [Hyphomicrobiales bacterium]